MHEELQDCCEAPVPDHAPDCPAAWDTAERLAWQDIDDDDGVPELIGAGSVFGSWSALSLLAGELATTL